MNKLYTLIIDYRKGTYITQVKASDVKEALMKGISNLQTKDIMFFGEKVKQKMLDEAFKEEIVPIMGTQNVFTVGLSPFGYFTIVHLICTES